MSLVPYLYDNFLRSLDRQFDTPFHPENSLLPWTPSDEYFTNHFRQLSSLLRSLDRGDAGSKITQDKDKFEITLDVKQFSPEEITVKTYGDNQVVIEGNHEEKEDEYGTISRHFVRRYILPRNHNVEGVISNLSSDGILTITAPKDKMEEIERNVPIAINDDPKKSISHKD